MNEKSIFRYEDEVKDSELDVLGIVNHTHYLLYMMHARHQHIKSLGLDFMAFQKKGFNLVLARAELQFKYPLTSGDRYAVTSKIVSPKTGRFAFEQTILKLPDEKLVVAGDFTAACLSQKTGKPIIPAELRDFLRATR